MFAVIVVIGVNVLIGTFSVVVVIVMIVMIAMSDGNCVDWCLW